MPIKITAVDDPEKLEVCTIPVLLRNLGTLALTGIKGQAGKTLDLGLVCQPREVWASAAPFISLV